MFQYFEAQPISVRTRGRHRRSECPRSRRLHRLSEVGAQEHEGAAELGRERLDHPAPRELGRSRFDRGRPTNIELRTPATAANAIPESEPHTPGTKLDRQDGGPKMTMPMKGCRSSGALALFLRRVKSVVREVLEVDMKIGEWRQRHQNKGERGEHELAKNICWNCLVRLRSRVLARVWRWRS